MKAGVASVTKDERMRKLSASVVREWAVLLGLAEVFDRTAELHAVEGQPDRAAEARAKSREYRRSLARAMRDVQQVLS